MTDKKDTITFGKRLPFWCPMSDIDELQDEMEQYKVFFTSKAPLLPIQA